MMSELILISSIYYSEPLLATSVTGTMPPKSRSTTTLGSTVKIGHTKPSAYHRDFEQHLIDHGIHPENCSPQPYN